MNKKKITKNSLHCQRSLLISEKRKTEVIGKLDGNLKFKDYISTAGVYLGIGRNRYKIKPGLYSLGNPDSSSSVLVTSNYKMTVDCLKKSVKNMDFWILVLDTKGINVWCAAGKGTFGTAEIIKQIKTADLEKRVSHREIIVPQLGAPGINPEEVKKGCGFKVVYGPVKADDIPQFIKNNYTASKKMRKKQFPMSERFAVSITHLSQGFFKTLVIALIFIITDLIFLPESRSLTAEYLRDDILISLFSIFTATIISGLMLPILPGRSFTVKGLSIGIIFSAFSFYYLMLKNPFLPALYNSGKIMVLLSWIIYNVFNLTGSSTYTSLSGVMKEFKYSIIPITIGAIAGIVLILIGGFLI